MNLKIMIACHKKCDVPSDPVYLPIHVGAEGKELFGFQPDNTGDNISVKNPLYCELTGLYWCWKNLNCDYIGLVHYRRYFTLKGRIYQKQHESLDCVLTHDEAESLLKKYTILVPKKRRYYIETIYNHYSHTFDGRQLDCAREVLAEKYPEYTETFDEFMKGSSGYMFNMFIMPKELCDRYCTWLFDVLSEVEKKYDVSGLTAFEARYSGRISERLFNVWLLQQMKQGTIRKEMIREIPYLYFGRVDWPRKIGSFLTAKFLHRKYDKSF